MASRILFLRGGIVIQRGAHPYFICLLALYNVIDRSWLFYSNPGVVVGKNEQFAILNGNTNMIKNLHWHHILWRYMIGVALNIRLPHCLTLGVVLLVWSRVREVAMTANSIIIFNITWILWNNNARIHGNNALGTHLKTYITSPMENASLRFVIIVHTPYVINIL